ncbi:glycosyltransferase family 2 protein [Pontibacter cellulosilyticus]|uniref:Glycosyltransferase n=1 Tax=Pontibacter cellulosilyticus TaxID=1720253 RepID=A0A923SLY7_9BACT|nr:glycosyltransferase family 2 protein [Pontibacter cellulosilyticus]MBC5991630.1 glycosyltransferase [Pontibacter cellulosilyticus]
MKVSIITIVFNNAETIADAIDSVLGQTYPDIEYIVVDGASTDGTVDVIKSYGDRISKFVSEKDNGLYDAINKGIGLATGDVIGLLHSDDLFYSKQTVTQIVYAFLSANTESVYGDLLYVDKQNTSRIIRNWISGKYKKISFRYGWMPPHPTFYVKRTIYEKLGLYNTYLQSAADYELMLRYLYKNDVSTTYIPSKLVKMRVGGKSNGTFKNRLLANQEDYRAWLINGLKPPFYTRFLKPLRKLLQFTFFKFKW